MTRVTGKLLKNEELGIQYGCQECSNTNHSDDCVVLYGIDTEHHIPHDAVQSMAGDTGHLNVVRDLYDAFPYSRKQIVSGKVVK